MRHLEDLLSLPSSKVGQFRAHPGAVSGKTNFGAVSGKTNFGSVPGMGQFRTARPIRRGYLLRLRLRLRLGLGLSSP